MDASNCAFRGRRPQWKGFRVLVVSALLLAAAILIFGRVRRDYYAYGKLTLISTFLEVLISFLHGSASYAFLDSNLSHINQASPLFFLLNIFSNWGIMWSHKRPHEHSREEPCLTSVCEI
jgi:hypothetical protein